MPAWTVSQTPHWPLDSVRLLLLTVWYGIIRAIFLYTKSHSYTPKPPTHPSLIFSLSFKVLHDLVPIPFLSLTPVTANSARTHLLFPLSVCTLAFMVAILWNAVPTQSFVVGGGLFQLFSCK